MEIYKLPLGSLEANCYIVPSENNNAVAIDTGANPQKILAFLREKKLKLKKILLTHGHFDHTGATAQLVAETGAKVYIHGEDVELLNDSRKSAAYLIGANSTQTITPDVTYKDGDIIKMDNLEFKVIHTPGHTRGSSMFVLGDYIFTGDTIFMGSVGRVDMYSGDLETQLETLDLIRNLQGEFQLFSGHGPDTSLSHEKRTNPYLKGGINVFDF